MAKPTNAENKKIMCHRMFPSRSSAINDNSDSAQNVVEVDDFYAPSETAEDVNVRLRGYVTSIVPNNTMLPGSRIGDRVRARYVDSDKSANPYDADDFIKTRNGFVNVLGVANEIDDPGDEGAIPVTASGTVNLVTEAAETRTLAAPSFPGQELVIGFQTDGGDCVLTVATGVNQTGNDTATFADAGDILRLVAIRVGEDLRWRVAANDGVALATA